MVLWLRRAVDRNIRALPLTQPTRLQNFFPNKLYEIRNYAHSINNSLNTDCLPSAPSTEPNFGTESGTNPPKNRLAHSVERRQLKGMIDL